MLEYLFVDGPLAGQSLGSSEAHHPGEVLSVEVVDVIQGPEDQTHFAYYVESGPDRCRPGRLRHSVQP